MSFHSCPIEPWEWGNGDDPPEPVVCPECDGVGDGPHGEKSACPRCKGECVIDPPDPPDFDDDYL